jgi:hypothetical protein
MRPPALPDFVASPPPPGKTNRRLRNLTSNPAAGRVLRGELLTSSFDLRAGAWLIRAKPKKIYRAYIQPIFDIRKES